MYVCMYTTYILIYIAGETTPEYLECYDNCIGTAADADLSYDIIIPLSFLYYTMLHET